MADTDVNPFSRFYDTRRVVTDEGEQYIEWLSPRYGTVPERVYVVTDADVDRPDTIALKTLGDDRLWWMILDYNHIQDPMALETGDKLIIPQFDLPPVTSAAEVLEEEVPTPPIRTRCVSFPPFQDPALIEETPTAPVDTSQVVVLTFGFPVPPCLSGLGHFQIQASLLPDFSTIVLSKLTQADVTRWTYYNPSANSGAGGFEAYPIAGIDFSTLSGQTVQHNIIDGELVSENSYFFRFKAWYEATPGVWTETEWYSPPSINIP